MTLSRRALSSRAVAAEYAAWVTGDVAPFRTDATGAPGSRLVLFLNGNAIPIGTGSYPE